MLATALLALLSASPPQQPGANRAEYRECAAALAGATSSGPAVIAERAPHTICYAGGITPEAMAALGAKVARVPVGAPLTLVAMSNGGDVYSGIDVGSLLAQRDATFIAGPVCASACANYLFLGARHRIVPAGSVVAFHGGLSPGFLKSLRRDVARARRQRPADPAKVASLERTLRESTAAAPRERAMLRAIGADPGFFAFFDDVPYGKWRATCPGPANHDQVFVFSPEQLRRRGINVEGWNGPRSQAELDSTLQAMGLPVPMCFWR